MCIFFLIHKYFVHSLLFFRTFSTNSPRAKSILFFTYKDFINSFDTITYNCISSQLCYKDFFFCNSLVILTPFTFIKQNNHYLSLIIKHMTTYMLSFSTSSPLHQLFYFSPSLQYFLFHIYSTFLTFNSPVLIPSLPTLSLIISSSK